MIEIASKKDIVWGYFSQFLNIGSGILIIPVAIKYLATEDMGLWYLFIAIAGLAQLLELGFQPTISRMTSYVYSGALDLIPEGIPKKTDTINYQLLYDLVLASKKIYKYVSVATAFVFLVIGTSYLNTFEDFQNNQLVAWLLFSFASTLNFYYTYFNGLIIGRGQQVVLYRITAISKLAMLLITLPLLIGGVGLFSMSIGLLFSVIISRVLLFVKFYDRARLDVVNLSSINKSKDDLSLVLWKSSWKLGVTSIGSFLILRSNQFITSSYLGLGVAASYGLTLQLIGIISTLSAMYFNLNLPKINTMQASSSKKAIRKIFTKSLLVTIFMFISGIAAFVLIGLPILDLLSPNTEVLPLTMLLFLSFVLMLELNHSVCATYLTTLNVVPFMYASVFSGILIVSTSLIMVNLMGLGVLGIIVSQFVVQLSYNNWRWPYLAFKDLRNEK